MWWNSKFNEYFWPSILFHFRMHFCLFDSAVRVWCFSRCTRFIIDCLCDRKRIQPSPFDSAEHESTRLYLSHQKASLHGLTLVGCLHPLCVSHVRSDTQPEERSRSHLSLTLSAFCTLLVSFFLIIWHFKHNSSWLLLPLFRFSVSSDLFPFMMQQ